MSFSEIQNFSHLEVNTKDLKATIEYYTDVLGMPLVSIQWVDQEKGSVRAFLKLNEQTTMSLLCTPDTAEEIDFGTTHSGNAGDATNTGTMQHLAFNVDTLDELYEVRDRIRSKGVHCVGPMNHGFCYSVYFLGPDAVTLEVSTLTATDLNPWIVDSVAEAIGLNQEELLKLRTV